MPSDDRRATRVQVMFPTGPQAPPDKVLPELPYSRDETRGIAAPNNQHHSDLSATPSKVPGPPKHILALAESLSPGPATWISPRRAT